MTQSPTADQQPSFQEIPDEELAKALSDAQALLRDGDTAAAVQLSLDTIQRGGIGMVPLSMFHKILSDAGQTEIATALRTQMLAVLDEAEEAGGAQGDALSQLCMVRLELEDLDGALRMGKDIYLANPYHHENLFLYTLVMVKHGSFDRANIDPAKAFETVQNPVALITGLVSLLANFGRSEQALALLDECADFVARDAERNRVATLRASLLDEDPEIDQRAMATDIFDNFAAGYDEKLEKLGNNGPQLIGIALQILELDPDGSRDILDAGSGTGLCAPYLRPYGRHLHGADLSIPMLEMCKKKGTFDLLTRTDLAVRETFPDATFDLIVSGDVLVYFGALDKVFSNLIDVLRPGGRFIFTLEEAPEPAPARGYAYTPSGRNCHTEAYVRGVLENVGFGPVDLVHRDNLRMEFGKPIAGMVISACKPA